MSETFLFSSKQPQSHRHWLLTILTSTREATQQSTKNSGDSWKALMTTSCHREEDPTRNGVLPHVIVTEQEGHVGNKVQAGDSCNRIMAALVVEPMRLWSSVLVRSKQAISQVATMHGGLTQAGCQIPSKALSHFLHNWTGGENVMS